MMSKNVFTAFLLVAIVAIMAEEEPYPNPCSIPGIMCDGEATTSPSETTPDPAISKASSEKETSSKTEDTTSSASSKSPAPPKKGCKNDSGHRKCCQRKKDLRQCDEAEKNLKKNSKPTHCTCP